MSKMSEHRRVSLTTIGSSVASTSAAAAAAAVGGFLAPTATAAASLRFGSDFSAAQDANKASSAPSSSKNSSNKTIRLKLEMFQTDSCSYPEFNYSKLLHLEKDNNDDEVARIAKELEQKYGSTYGSGRGRSKKDDHCDIGLGYDESDSFIDNTEAYDEVIPEEVETLEGGFYINCGALEFKKLHNESTVKTKTDEIIKMPNRPKKRILSTSSEDSSSDDDDAEDDAEDEENDASTKTKPSSGGAPAEKRHKTGAAGCSANTSTSSKKSHENGKKKKDQEQQLPVIAISVSSSNSPKPTTDDLGSDSDMRQKALVKTTTVKDMLKAKRDNFLKMQTVNGGGEVKGSAAKSSGDDDESSSDDSDDSEAAGSDSNQSAPQDKKTKKTAANAPGTTGEEKSSREEKLRATDTKLPELEADVVASILEFKELVKSKSMTGKMFHFDDRLTEVFLRIDESLLCIEKPQRNMVFAHLEFHLTLPKYFFLRKAKQLRIKEEKLKSKRALGKLRKAIIETMPGAIASYEVELRKYADINSGNLNAEHPPKMPKKKFPWTNNLRNLLYDVYQVRWTSYPVLGTRKDQLEDFINVYMRTKVTELWPSGWMRYEELQKEIEKRKVASKKAKDKEKKKDVGGVAARGATVAPAVGATASSLAAIATATTTTTPQVATTNPTTYIKQFEDFATSSSRSCANSDTDSVASSSGSGLKRKVTPDGAHKLSKSCKAAKVNGEPPPPNKLQANAAEAAAAAALDLISPSKRTDHSIHHIISHPAEANSPIPPASIAVVPQQRHSTSAQVQSPPTAPPHVIDLDNYKSASDILQTSKQLLAVPGSAATAAIKPEIRRESCSDSDGVEFIGCFPAKPLPAVVVAPAPVIKQRYKKNATGSSQSSSRSATPNNSNTVHSESSPVAAGAAAAGTAAGGAVTMSAKTLTPSSSSASTTSHSTANNKKSTKASLSSTAIFDANQVVNVLKELEDLQQKQQKHLASPQNASKKEPHQ